MSIYGIMWYYWLWIAGQHLIPFVGGIKVKIKKLIVVMIAACMLVMAQAAYANEVSPSSVGIGDTRETAIPLTPCGSSCNMTQLPLSTSTDVDWFKWTNNTGSEVFASADMISPSGINYALAYQMQYSNGSYSSKFYAPDAGNGGWNVLYGIYVPNGATIYLEVSSRGGFNNQAFYSLAFRVN